MYTYKWVDYTMKNKTKRNEQLRILGLKREQQCSEHRYVRWWCQCTFFSGGNLQQLEFMSSNYLHELSKWFHLNRLALNTSKTKFMLFYRENETVIYEIRLKYCGTALQRVNSHSFLGVILNKPLSWSNNINNIRVKVARSVGMVRRLYSVLPGWFGVPLYYSIIH